jgi:putative addiction module component (TIGR02574 family)
MSKAEILRELPKLASGDRREIFERIVELEDEDLLKGGEPTAEEKALLDRELDDYQRKPEAGSSWEEVKDRLRKPTRK